MRRLLIFGVAMLVAVAVALIVPALFAQKADVAAGKAAYTKRCVSCHGPEGEGKEAIGKMMKVEMKHLGSKEVQAKTNAQLKKDMTEGVGKMKAVAGMNDAEVANIIAFMRTLAKK